MQRWRSSLRAVPPGVLALLLLVSTGSVARGQESDAGGEMVEGEIQERIERHSRPEFTPVDPSIPPADLSDEAVDLLAAAAVELFPLLPHEPEGQPGSAVDGFSIIGTVADSVGGRGRVALAPEEWEPIVAALEARGIRARFCGAACPGRYGDAALTFHLPRIEGDEVTIWLLTRWAIGTLPSNPPDRVLHRADELRLRRSEAGWQLAAHEKLREEVRELLGPSPIVTE